MGDHLPRNVTKAKDMFVELSRLGSPAGQFVSFYFFFGIGQPVSLSVYSLSLFLPSLSLPPPPPLSLSLLSPSLVHTSRTACLYLSVHLCVSQVVKVMSELYPIAE